MKKTILLFIIFIFPLFSFAQFKLTKEGFFDSNDLDKSYIVLNTDSTTKEVAFNNVLKYLTQVYNSAKDVISKVDNEIITINAKEPRIIFCKNQKYDMAYTFSIIFRDRRIKIDSPVFKCTAYSYDKPYRLTMSGSNGGFGTEVTIGLFKKNGEQSHKRTISEIETFFNTFSTNIQNAAMGENVAGENEDW